MRTFNQYRKKLMGLIIADVISQRHLTLKQIAAIHEVSISTVNAYMKSCKISRGKGKRPIKLAERKKSVIEQYVDMSPEERRIEMETRCPLPGDLRPAARVEMTTEERVAAFKAGNPKRDDSKTIKPGQFPVDGGE